MYGTLGVCETCEHILALLDVVLCDMSHSWNTIVAPQRGISVNVSRGDVTFRGGTKVFGDF